MVQGSFRCIDGGLYSVLYTDGSSEPRRKLVGGQGWLTAVGVLGEGRSNPQTDPETRPGK